MAVVMTVIVVIMVPAVPVTIVVVVAVVVVVPLAAGYFLEFVRTTLQVMGVLLDLVGGLL